MELHKEEERTQSIVNSVRRIVRVLRESSRAAERTVGLSGAQLFVLRQLADVGSLAVGALAARTLTHQSTVSEVVGRLAAGGLVTRTPSPRDARVAEVALTAAGRRLLERAPGAAQERLKEGIARLAPRERALLGTLLVRLLEEMKIATEPATLFFEEPAKPAPRARGRQRHGA